MVLSDRYAVLSKWHFHHSLVRFRQGGNSSEGRAARRAASVRASRMAALRAAGVALVLVYLTYRAILWIESQDYGGFLQFMKANG